MAYANGRIPRNLLTVVNNGRLMRDDAAKSLGRMNGAFRRRFGKDIYVTDGYRDYDQQVAVKKEKGKFAATPGTSTHGLATAGDLGSNINNDKSEEHKWMDVNASEYGWVNPVWARDSNPNNGQYEPWHWEYVPALDKHAGGTLSARPVEEKKEVEDTDMGILLRKKSNGATMFVQGGRAILVVGGTGDLESYLGAGVKLVNLSDAGFDLAYAKYMP